MITHTHSVALNKFIRAVWAINFYITPTKQTLQELYNCDFATRSDFCEQPVTLGNEQPDNTFVTWHWKITLNCLVVWINTTHGTRVKLILMSCTWNHSYCAIWLVCADSERAVSRVMPSWNQSYHQLVWSRHSSISYWTLHNIPLWQSLDHNIHLTEWLVIFNSAIWKAQCSQDTCKCTQSQ
jgi:hypothetical protein